MIINAVNSGSGGAERFAMALSKQLATTGVEVSFCVTRQIEPWALNQLTAANVVVLNLNRTRVWQVHRFIPLWRHLRMIRGRNTVVHTHMFGSNVWGMLVAWLAGVRIRIAQEHTWSYVGQPLRRVLDRILVARLATCFLAVSERDAHLMNEVEGIPPEKIVILPTSFELNSSGFEGGIRWDLINVTDDCPVVCTAAMLRPQKALDVLIEAFSRVHRRIPSAKLVIAGEGECRTSLEAQVDALGISEAVHFLGAIPDSGPLLSRADVSVLSSDFEGMPLFALECMQAGVPFVATRVGGLPSLIDDGQSGFLVPPRDPSALAHRIELILNDKERASSIVARAHERVAQYQLPEVARKYADLYWRSRLPVNVR